MTKKPTDTRLTPELRDPRFEKALPKGVDLSAPDPDESGEPGKSTVVLSKKEKYDALMHRYRTNRVNGKDEDTASVAEFAEIFGVTEYVASAILAGRVASSMNGQNLDYDRASDNVTNSAHSPDTDNSEPTPPKAA